MPGVMSAAGLVGFLSEPDTELQVFALRAANDGISLMWTEFAGDISLIEALYEDESFPERELAALVAAKIYYHLQAYDESMSFALRAGKLFAIDAGGEFEDTIIARCIDTYISSSAQQKSRAISDAAERQGPQFAESFQHQSSSSTSAAMTSPITPFSQTALPSKSELTRADSTAIDAEDDQDFEQEPKSSVLSQPGTLKALQAVIRRIFERCFQDGMYRQVVGIAVEAKNLDILRETITRAGKEVDKANKSRKANTKDELMDYLLDICMNIIQERSLRNEILQLILDLLISNDVDSPDYLAIAKCIVYLGQSSMAAERLRQLVEKDEPKSLVMAYQMSFDLFDNGTQEFLTKVMDELPQTEEQESEFANTNGHATEPNENQEASESTQLLSQSGEGSAATSTLASRAKYPISEEQRKSYKLIREILTGTKSLELNLEFLFRSSKADHQILTKLKNSLEARNSIFHSAVTFANAFMNSGTTADWFFRENVEWLGKAVNWSKFSVTAALGVIHRGNIGQGRKLLDPYLRSSSSAYSKGGALFGLGLIYTNHGKHVVDYLFEQLRDAQSEEIVQHGAALGLGVAGMATEAEHVVEQLRLALWSDSAISGQAAGIGIGLVLLGSGKVDALQNLIDYAHETQHDKTIRGIAMGMALIVYGRQEAADELINGLLDDADPILRYGGIMSIAMAYCGTSSNKAVRKLLHVAVSDVNDDVRRVAVMSLGFVLFRKPGTVPRMVELLAESYNPHVRYGATMALGIACAGTGLEEAIDLLEPMMKDPTDFVRQGTHIALAMIMVQQSESMNTKTISIRKHLQKVISDRHEDAMAKFGASLALGIIDAGGRNCTIGLQTQTGNLNMAGIVGMAVFTQYWYWFPLSHFLSLSFTPTTVIGVDQDLEVPQLKMYCNARPSAFDYPPSMEVKQEEAPEKVKTAILSTTAQAQRRRKAKDRQQRGESMEVDKETPTTPKVPAIDDKMDVDEVEVSKDGASKEEGKDSEKGKEKSAKDKKEKEKVGFEIDNMSRVLPAQLKYTSFVEGRYSPVKKPTGGVVLLHDNEPDSEKTLIERKLKKPRSRSQHQGTTGEGSGAAAPQTPAAQTAGRTLPMSAILNAIDDDPEGAEEPSVPGSFEYESEGEE